MRTGLIVHAIIIAILWSMIVIGDTKFETFDITDKEPGDVANYVVEWIKGKLLFVTRINL